MKNVFGLLILLFFINGCSGQSEKINGVSFVASRQEVKQANIDPVVNVNANHAAVMPFGFIRSLDQPTISYNTERQWFGETKAGVKQYVEMLHKNRIKVMLKPQIWVWRGEFTGYLKMNSEADWKTLEESYRNFILEYAEVAQNSEVDIFCVGTELEQFIVHRPDYWHSLISEIKQIYKGKLTYAANWDEYKRVPFWSALDYIGVDAYFPVSDSKTPTLEECKAGWQKWKSELKGVAEKEGKKILFAEYGYRSVDFSGREPWKSDRDMTVVNLAAQKAATQALFEEIWDQPWFAGGYIWKWYINHSESGGVDNARFTPQNKPAEEVIKFHYAKK